MPKKDYQKKGIFRGLWRLLDNMGLIMTGEEFRFLRSLRK